MLRMVDNLLDVSRLDAGQLDLQLQRVNLVSLATQVLDQQRPAATGQELVLETDQPELWIECDSMRVRQVLTNLVNNAIKYSPPDTTITVHLTMRAVTFDQQEQTSTSEPLSIELGQSGQSEMLDAQEKTPYEALIRVCDEGGGIPVSQQVRLFERFFRAKNRRAEGLGLGLYLSRQFVLMHGGTVWVESVEDQGCTFCFTLPMREK
jgi:two-component system phosphate regulon sensor histidine kinase PhoR